MMMIHQITKLSPEQFLALQGQERKRSRQRRAEEGGRHRRVVSQ
jgi:hypothetical protein